MCNFFTTTTETSQNSSKWSHYSTDHWKLFDLFIRPLKSQLLDLGLSLIGDIFANIKTKITLLFTVTQPVTQLSSNSWSNNKPNGRKFCEKVKYLSLIIVIKEVWWINQYIYCNQWKNRFILKSFEKFLL